MVFGIRRSISNQNNDQSCCNNLLNGLKHSEICLSKHYKLQKCPLYETNSIRIIRADHIDTNTNLVIKIVDLESSSDENDHQSSIIDVHSTEINLIAKLRHTNVLRMLTSFVDNNNLWQVMPYAEYGSADQWSKPNGLPEIIIALIVKDVLNGLNYLHRKGIIHRAICGSHILIMSNGNCVLTGLKYSINVIQMGRWQPRVHQYPKQAKKLLNFLAPEILEQNLLGYNSKSDIYSLGIVCCELANGCVPFEDIVLTEMLLDKLTGNFPRPLDSTCIEIQNFPIDDPNISIETQEKYNLYKNRTFSTNFHMFTIDHCLNFDSSTRSTAAELLDHPFLKQIKKYHHNHHHHHHHHNNHKNKDKNSNSLLIELLKTLSKTSHIINNNNNNNGDLFQNNNQLINKDHHQPITITNIENQSNKHHETTVSVTDDWVF